MALRVTCPSCKTPFSATEEQRGKKVSCAQCGKALMIPAAAKASSNGDFKAAAKVATPPPRKAAAARAKDRYDDEPEGDEDEAPRKGSGGAIVVGGGIGLLVVAGAAVGLYFAFIKEPDSSKKDTSTTQVAHNQTPPAQPQTPPVQPAPHGEQPPQGGQPPSAEQTPPAQPPGTTPPPQPQDPPKVEPPKTEIPTTTPPAVQDPPKVGPPPAPTPSADPPAAPTGAEPAVMPTTLSGEQIYQNLLKSTVWIRAKQKNGITVRFGRFGRGILLGGPGLGGSDGPPQGGDQPAPPGGFTGQPAPPGGGILGGQPQPPGGFQPPPGFKFPPGFQPPPGFKFPAGFQPPPGFKFPANGQPQVPGGGQAPPGFQPPAGFQPPGGQPQPPGGAGGGQAPPGFQPPAGFQPPPGFKFPAGGQPQPPAGAGGGQFPPGFQPPAGFQPPPGFKFPPGFQPPGNPGGGQQPQAPGGQPQAPAAPGGQARAFQPPTGFPGGAEREPIQQMAQLPGGFQPPGGFAGGGGRPGFPGGRPGFPGQRPGGGFGGNPPGFPGNNPGKGIPQNRGNGVDRTKWTGNQTLEGYGTLEFVFLGKIKGENRVLMDDSRETAPGTYELNGTDITLKFFSGDLTYTGKINQGAGGSQLTGTAKDASATWNFTANQESMPGALTVTIRPTSTGSGSLIDRKHRLVLTNCHVVGDADDVTCHFPEFDSKGELIARRDLYKRKKGIHGKVVYREVRIDLALIQLDEVPKGIKPLAMAKASARPGQKVHSLGNPGVSAALWVYSPGSVRQLYRHKWKVYDDFEDKEYTYEGMRLETDSPINPGDSGGPLVNERGLLVGVTHASRVDAQSLSIFIDVSEARDVVTKYYQSIGETWVPEPPPGGLVSITQVTDWVKRLSDEDIGKRVRACQALGEMGEGARLGFSDLFQALRDKNALVRHAAAEALEKIPPHRDDLAMLRDACKSSKEPTEVRVQAAKALAQLATDARPALPDLFPLLKDSDDGLRLAALSAVAAIGPGAGDVPALGDLLKSPSADVRRLSMQALARLGAQAKDAVPMLGAALKDADRTIRLQAAVALESIGTGAKSATPALTDALKDSDAEVSLAAARALMKLGEPKVAVPHLVDVLKGTNQDQKRLAIQALATAGHEAKAAATQLVRALDDEALRGDAVEALVKIGKYAVTPVAKTVTAVAKNVVKMPEPAVRRAWIDVIRRVGTTERLGAPYRDQALGALRFLLRDPDPGNRDAAQQAGSAIQSKRS